MSADLWVFAIAWTAGVFALGVETALWALPPKPPEIRRVIVPVHQANILTCPVTAATVAEHHRICRARKRTTAVQPRENAK